MFFKRTFPLALTLVLGVVFSFQYYIPHKKSEDLLTLASDWELVIGIFALLLGILSLLHVHARKIRRRALGWGYSLIVYLGIVIMVTAGVMSSGRTLQEDPATGNQVSTPMGWVYDYMFTVMQGAMFSILAFYLASAAFRAFRARSFEATMLLVAALFIMVGQVPLGQVLYAKTFHGSAWGQAHIPSIGAIKSWIMATLNMSAQRAILMGIALGSIATALKIIFGIERSYLGGGKES